MYLHKVINIYTHMLGGPNTWLCVGRLCAYKLYRLLLRYGPFPRNAFQTREEYKAKYYTPLIMHAHILMCS